MLYLILSTYYEQYIQNAIVAIWLFWIIYWGAAWVYDLGKYKQDNYPKLKLSLYGALERLLLGIALVLVLVPFNQNSLLVIRYVSATAIIPAIGIVMAIVGVFFAIWARIHLGSNWSATIRIKKGQTLVKTGPYAIVRHPIYSGITLAMVGSAIAIENIAGLLAVLFVLIFSYIRIKHEEKLVRKKFGKEYENYANKVKVYIPFIY